jgi:hypothetical protein
MSWHVISWMIGLRRTVVPALPVASARGIGR